jgi:hypothetical protein
VAAGDRVRGIRKGFLAQGRQNLGAFGLRGGEQFLCLDAVLAGEGEVA